MEELFILGNPRFLSGGAATSCVIDYGMPPPTVESLRCGKVTSESVLNPMHLGKSLAARVSACGQQVHSGKSGYHHRPRFNVFLHDGENPTAGIELETESRVRNEPTGGVSCLYKKVNCWNTLRAFRTER